MQRFIHAILPREFRDLNRHLSISFMAALLIGGNVLFSSETSSANLASLFPPTPEVTAQIISNIQQYTPTIQEDPQAISTALLATDNAYFEQLSTLGIAPNSDGSGDSINEIGELYTVQAGDSFAKIASAAGLRTESLLVANNIDAKKIKSDAKALNLKEGQKIIIPFENLDSGDNLLQIAIDSAAARKQATAQIQSSRNNATIKSKKGKTTLVAVGKGRDYGSYFGFTLGWCTAGAAKFRPDIGAAVRSMGGGNAAIWDKQAKKAGFQVDRSPENGAIIKTNESRAGHVSQQIADLGDSIKIREYNGPAGRGVLGERIIPKSMIATVIH